MDRLITQVTAELDVSSIPTLNGASECVSAGVLSSIHSQNAKASAAVEDPEQAIQHQSWPLLVDPQTGSHSNPPGPQTTPTCPQLDPTTPPANPLERGAYSPLTQPHKVILMLSRLELAGCLTDKV